MRGGHLIGAKSLLLVLVLVVMLAVALALAFSIECRCLAGGRAFSYESSQRLRIAAGMCFSAVQASCGSSALSCRG
ncbi:hypothetical protein V8C40DRAFT_250604 [Trichoderma camerunense]